MTTEATPRMLRVMQSFPEGRTTTNPYLLQLLAGLAPYTEVSGLSWRRGLTHRVDVFHVHWPELLLRARSPGRRWTRRVLVRTLLLKWRLQHTAIVRTVHNTESHEALPPRDKKLLARLDRQTSLWIRLNLTTDIAGIDAMAPDAPVRTITHGDYRTWFAGSVVPPPVSGRLLHFGLLRPYKGIPALIDAFAGCSDSAAAGTVPLTLHICGAPVTPAFGAEVVHAAGDDPRITVALGHATDAALAHEIGQAELVVLPYREMHNSGAALLALSLARPVLVPSNAVTRALREEVGAGWVFAYDGALSAELLREAVARTREHNAGSQPNLAGRDWPRVVAEHLEAYRAAVGRVASLALEQPGVGGEPTVTIRKAGRHA
ncbi:GDP-mannose--glycolipid 4-beta-D-mannosyltransferase [Cryobacterium psychrophilum]|uniref:GDP-mannose--glycolipid 4-beta-D-mannosyltransferase n=1 Tax=Cryobacterium psychrophilum TaxID=41988 RepID=A0A4Y8KPN5_9MICO|nr:GDP-mannose--glycolipid 4-beta-D-mannosyltransferase [Cryobacterium psychrophilum]TDW29956.1 beta-1,4-mannosyltransferase [Cryobacterium psychrophilum]TFD76519.1 GDP-mannose--glycolipid 4-beta-D-mannosyltransferase [Cryobacterium psychrophilum]